MIFYWVNMFRNLLLVSCLVLVSFGGYVNHKKKTKSFSVVPFTTTSRKLVTKMFVVQ